MRQISIVLVLAALAATAACQDQEAGPVGPEAPLALSMHSGSSTYEVTVTNETGAQPFTPPLAVTHRGSLDVFEVGEPASLGVREIAENGNHGPLEAALTGLDDVSAGARATGSLGRIRDGAKLVGGSELNRTTHGVSGRGRSICLMGVGWLSVRRIGSIRDLVTPVST